MKTKEKLNLLIDILVEQRIIGKKLDIGWFSHDGRIPSSLVEGGRDLQSQVANLNRKIDHLINYLELEFKETSVAGFVKKSK